MATTEDYLESLLKSIETNNTQSSQEPTTDVPEIEVLEPETSESEQEDELMPLEEPTDPNRPMSPEEIEALFHQEEKTDLEESDSEELDLEELDLEESEPVESELLEIEPETSEPEQVEELIPLEEPADPNRPMSPEEIEALFQQEEESVLEKSDSEELDLEELDLEESEPVESEVLEIEPETSEPEQVEELIPLEESADPNRPMSPEEIEALFQQSATSNVAEELQDKDLSQEESAPVADDLLIDEDEFTDSFDVEEEQAVTAQERPMTEDDILSLLNSIEEAENSIEEPESLPEKESKVEEEALDPQIASLVEQIPELADITDNELENKLDRILIQDLPDSESAVAAAPQDDMSDADILDLLDAASSDSEDLAEINDLLKKNDSNEPILDTDIEIPDIEDLSQETVEEGTKTEKGKKKKWFGRKKENALDNEMSPEGEAEELPKKKGLLSKLLELFTASYEDESQEELEDKQLATGENLDILNELDDEKDKKKKVKKEKKPKKEKPPKAEKVKKEKKPKKAKEADPDDGKPVKKLPKKGLICIILCAISVLVFVFIAAIFMPKFSSLNSARKNYEKGEYNTVYEELSGMKLSGEDAQLYRKVKLILILENQYDDHTYYTSKEMPLEALDALVYGVQLADRYSAEAEELGIEEEFSEVTQKLLAALDETFHVSQEQAREWNKAKDAQQYSRALNAFLFGETAVTVTETEDTKESSILPDDEVIDNMENQGVAEEINNTEVSANNIPKPTETKQEEGNVSDNSVEDNDGNESNDSGVYGSDNSGLIKQDINDLLSNTHIDIEVN